MAALVIIDQVTKLFIVRLFEVGESITLIKGVLNFTYVRNEGAAFGMLSDNRWIFLIISTVAIIALLIYMWKYRPKSRVACFAMSMIAAGGIGNMIDRVARGEVYADGKMHYYVVDFIDFCAFGELWKWVFNVADTCVCVGCGLIVLCLIISIIKEAKAKNAPAMAEASEALAEGTDETRSQAQSTEEQGIGDEQPEEQNKQE